jgi:prevent-host-death family protein
MTSLPLQEASNNLPDLVRRVSQEKERLLVKGEGEQIVAIIPVEDLELVEAIEDRIDIEEARAALREAEEKGTIPLDDFLKELGL